MSSEASTSAPVFSKPLQLPLPKDELDRVNSYLRNLTPEEILRWAVYHLPGLYQTTAFGLTGLVAIDMLAKITPNPPPLIFIDTLYHFPETLELVEEVKKRYGISVHVYKPEGCATAEDFEKKYGVKLWEMDETLYDYAVKVSALCTGQRVARISLIFCFSRLSPHEEHMTNSA